MMKKQIRVLKEGTPSAVNPEPTHIVKEECKKKEELR